MTGPPDLGMVVYHPTTREELDKTGSLITEAEPQ